MTDQPSWFLFSLSFLLFLLSPSLRFRLQLVVAIFLDFGSFGILSLCIFSSLFFYTIADSEVCECVAVLWLHGPIDARLLPPHGFHRLHCLLRLRQTNLFSHQTWLRKKEERTNEWTQCSSTDWLIHFTDWLIHWFVHRMMDHLLISCWQVFRKRNGIATTISSSAHWWPRRTDAEEE